MLPHNMRYYFYPSFKLERLERNPHDCKRSMQMCILQCTNAFKTNNSFMPLGTAIARRTLAVYPIYCSAKPQRVYATFSNWLTDSVCMLCWTLTGRHGCRQLGSTNERHYNGGGIVLHKLHSIRQVKCGAVALLDVSKSKGTQFRA